MLSEMQGIEILKKTELFSVEHVHFSLKNSQLLQTIGILLLGGLILVLMFVFCLKMQAEHPVLMPFFTLTGLIACVVCFCISAKKAVDASNKTIVVPTGKYEYEVLIEDTSLLKEIYENYDIIGAKGDIYILRDKNPETSSESE